MSKSTRVIAYTAAALLVLAVGGIAFATRPFARSAATPKPTGTHNIIATSSPITAFTSVVAPSDAETSSPVIVPAATPPAAATSSKSRSFSGLVSSVWDDRVIIESETSLVTGAVAPRTIVITPATQITGGTFADINIGTDISGSGTLDDSGAIMASAVVIIPPTQ